MAFGQEVKDFIGAFKAGYDMFESKEEREERRAKQKREKESHDAKMRWGDEDRDFRERSFDTKNQQWRQQFEATEEERGKMHGRWQQDHLLRKDNLILQGDKLYGTQGREQDNLDGFVEDERGKGTIPGVIPDDTDEDEEASYQPASYSPDAAAETVARNTSAYGFNLQSYLPSIKNTESSGRVDARNPRSSATGLYQPLKGTWSNYAKKYPELGLTPEGRTDPRQQERFIKRFTFDNLNHLERNGLPITNGTAYAAHFLGPQGATKVLKSDPRTPLTRLLSPDVIKANPFLSSMTVGSFARWAEERSGGIPKRRRSVNAAVGGMISAIPDDEEEENRLVPTEGFTQAVPDEGGEQVASAGAIPIPEDKPQYEGVTEGDVEEPTDDLWENARRSVRDGLKKAIKDNGLDTETALSDPRLEAARQRYLKGYGAAPHQMMKQVLDTIDPEKKMGVSERNMMAMGTVYRFYVDQGQLDKAQAAAQSMIQYYRMASTRFLALGQAAAEEGDLDKASKAAVAAYANIPNGRDLQIEKTDKGFNISVTDEKTGKVINKQVVSPQEFAAAAMQFNPATFEEEIMNAAGVPPEDTKRSTKASDSRLAGEAIDMAAEEAFADTPLSRRQQTTIKDVASNLHLTGENQMSPSVALDFAMRLSEFNKDDMEDDSAPFTVEPIRGTKEVRVTVDGRTVIMSQSNLNSLLHMRDSSARERAALREEAKKPSKWDKVGESAGNFIESLRGEPGGSNPNAVKTGVSDEVDELVNLRNTLRSRGMGPGVGKKLEEIEDRLRELGYDLEAEEGGKGTSLRDNARKFIEYLRTDPRPNNPSN